MSLDLHGYTIHEAWKRFRQYTHGAYLDGKKSIVVITGHGAMQGEFQGWCEADPYVTSAKRMDPNAGAFTVKIKKKKL